MSNRPYRVTYTLSDKCIVTTGQVEVQAGDHVSAEQITIETLNDWGIRLMAIDYVEKVR